MKSLDRFLEFHADRLTADRPIPIDLAALSDELGALVEEREMIPEGAMEARGGQFFIYLQSNFKDLPGATLRRRFSLAHEIAHLLFYERRTGELETRKDSPRGIYLEVACHKAAGMILVPSKQLKGELRRGIADAGAVADLAGRFEVSVEVMVRRMNELGAFEDSWTPVLTRRSGRNLVIEFAAYPPWLKSCLPAPKRGTDFTSWFTAIQMPDGRLKKTVGDLTLEARKAELTQSLVMFELRLAP